MKIDVPGACSELSELGAMMHDLAHSLESSHQRLYKQAHTDSLTDLPNRKALLDHLTTRAAKQDAGGTALLFIDLDDFKMVNDTFGHESGDQLLRVIADRLRSATRDNDLVARLGGDEFAVVVDEGADTARAVAVAERILDQLTTPVQVDGVPVAAHCSIGIASSGEQDELDPQQLLRNADLAMYSAKSSGKHRFELYLDTMHTEMVVRMKLKESLSQAVRRNELRLHYQPVVNIIDDSVIGWEGLVRWEHPDHGLLPPSEFIALAEETGDILAIGTWVCERACMDLVQVLDPARTGA